jgi:hypothetical protein
VADEAAGTVRVPLAGARARSLLDAVAVQFALMAELVRLVTVSVAVPAEPGATIRPLAGLASLACI